MVDIGTVIPGFLSENFAMVSSSFKARCHTDSLYLSPKNESQLLSFDMVVNRKLDA
jgi:hypothetical protein